VSLTFISDLFAEDKLLALARADQQATEFHRKHPDLDAAPEGSLRFAISYETLAWHYFSGGRCPGACFDATSAPALPLVSIGSFQDALVHQSGLAR